MGCWRTWHDGAVADGRRDSGPRVSWFELFYDLVVVALVLNGSGLFEEAPSFGTGAWLAATLLVLLVLWLSTTLTFNTTHREWTLRRILTLVQMLALVVASLSISRDSRLGDRTGLIALAVALASIAVLYWVKRAEPRTQRSSTVMAYSMGAAALVCVGGAIASDVAGSWGVILVTATLGLALTLVVVPLLAVLLRELVATGQLDHDHLSERMGQLVLIALGESFAALVITLGAADSIPNPVFLVLAFVVIYAIWSIYFRTVQPSGLPLGIGRTRAWIAAHYVLILGALGTADVFSALTEVSMAEGLAGLAAIQRPLPLLYVVVAFALLATLAGTAGRPFLRVHIVAALVLLGTIGAGLIGFTGQVVVMSLIAGAVVIGDAMAIAVIARSNPDNRKRARRDSNPQPTG